MLRIGQITDAAKKLLFNINNGLLSTGILAYII